MRPGLIKALGIVATLAVVVWGVVNERALFVDEGGAKTVLVPQVGIDSVDGPAISIHAGDGVRVNVERGRPDSSEAWIEGSVVVDVGWRATLARSVVWPLAGDAASSGLTARCENPIGVGRCAIWLTVLVPDPELAVVVWQSPGAVITDIDDGLRVDVRPA